MVCTPAVKALIRDDKVHQIYGIMQAGQKFGMQTMNQALCLGATCQSSDLLRRCPREPQLGHVMSCSK